MVTAKQANGVWNGVMDSPGSMLWGGSIGLTRPRCGAKLVQSTERSHTGVSSWGHDGTLIVTSALQQATHTAWQTTLYQTQ